MKKYFILSIILLIGITSQAQPADSLMNQREALYEKYSKINIPGKELSIKDYKSIVDILKKIIVVDTRIIESYSGVSVKIKNLEIEKQSLNTENNDLSKKISEYVRLSMITYISCGFLVTITIVLMILLILSKSKQSKLKKKEIQ